MSMWSWLRKFGLQGRVLVTTVVVFGISVAAALFAFQVIVNETIIQLGMRIAEKQVLFDRARSLQPLLREVALAQKLAQEPSILAWAKNEADPRLCQQGLEELEGFRRVFHDKSYFFVNHASGNYYFNNRESQYTGQELRYAIESGNPRDSWYFATIQTNLDCLLNVDYDEPLKVTKVWINCPVRGDGRILGLIGTGIELTDFIRDVVDIKQAGVENIFVDPSGAIQAHRDPALIDYNTLAKGIEQRRTIYQLLDSGRDRESFRALLDSLRDGKLTVATRFLSIGGRRHLAGVAFLDGMGWYNVTLMDLDVLIGSGHFTPIAILLAGALLLTLIAVAFLVHRFLLVRLQRLAGAVERLKTGDYAPPPVDPDSDEIGRLSQGFRLMAERVANHTQTLESEVARRTADLAREVEERRAAEERVRDSERHLRAILDAAPFPMLVSRLNDGVLLFLNGPAHALLGLAPGAGPGHRTVDFYANPDERQELVRRLYDTGMVLGTELRLRRPDGRQLWALLSAVRFRYGAEDAVIICANDISARKELERALREARDRSDEALTAQKRILEEQRKFVAMLSHEFRSPLAAIKIAAEMAMMNAAELPEKTADRLTRIGERAQHLYKMVDVFLASEALEHGQLAVKREALALGDFLRGVVERSPIPDAVQRVAIAVSPPEAAFDLDDELFGAALANLIENALRYSPPASPVAVEAALKDDGLTIVVRDQGRGMSAEEIERVGTQYFRAKSAEGTKGAGLGLAIACKVVAAHGGRIDIASQVGQGTTMTVRLPYAGAPSEPAPR
ncbi:MAG: PAS domain S-box protein [Rhodospirillales bacterium]|nr:PAS domain S-box protein [Rhodospirillales bacterium]